MSFVHYAGLKECGQDCRPTFDEKIRDLELRKPRQNGSGRDSAAFRSTGLYVDAACLKAIRLRRFRVLGRSEDQRGNLPGRLDEPAT